MGRDRSVYHVVPNANQTKWVISREGDSSLREEYTTKEEAVHEARSRARTQEPSQVKVHKANGTMEYESIYGDDPARSPG